MSVLARVVAATDSELASHTRHGPGEDRFAGMVEDEDRAFVLEAVYEGYLLHYAEPRAFTGMEPDLSLLAGDAMYALGLARLAERGDIEGVSELSDLISLCAWAEAEDRRDLVDELWHASANRLSGRGRGGEGARARLEALLAGGL